MNITFYGAAREVTGSMHLLKTAQDRILLDCGMFQGKRKESEAKNRILPFDPRILTNMVLSHAHIDHSGRIPLLVKQGFGGRVFCTRATAAASEYLLLDSANIQESDAAYLNYKSLRGNLSQIKPSARKKLGTAASMKEIKKILKKNRHELDTAVIEALMDRLRLERVRPLYTVEDARNALEVFDGYPYRYPVRIGTEVETTFYEAGHILGSSMVVVIARENHRTKTLLFSGDIGRFDKPIIRDPTLQFDDRHRRVDLMIMESTYGDRLHEPVGELKPQLRKVLTETHARGGSVLIPAFAFGRTQELLYVLHELYDAREVPRVPVFVDSPLAVQMTRVFGEHPELYDHNAHADFLQNGKNPFSFDQIHFVTSVQESMALNRNKKPHVVLAASGMCEGGRILHHLRYKIHDEKNTILIVGFMAQNTLGRRILERGIEFEKKGRSGPAPILRFLNKEYPLNAHVVSIGGFSAHGDQREMLRFLRESNLEIKKIAVVHGEEDQCTGFARHLQKEGYATMVPRQGESVSV